jgi:hypothetical protein
MFDWFSSKKRLPNTYNIGGNSTVTINGQSFQVPGNASVKNGC